MAKLMWLGVIDGKLVDEEFQDEFPSIANLGQKLSDFQNSQWRGEFNQKTSMTFGEIQNILLEISRLLKR